MEETRALTVPEPKRGIITREVLQEAAEQRKLLAEYIKSQMKEGVDYGVIPGTKDPTLLKPGAEKLVDLFRCTPKFKLIRSVEDFATGLFDYTFRVQLYQRDAGAVLAEGYGSANSREGRYRWRNAQRKCPTCNNETIFRSKERAEWFCWAKKGGCGAKFPAGDPQIEQQEAGRVENDDIATLKNTLLKMAKKRSLVDGAIALARVSDMFTQDLEDMPEELARATEPPMTAEDEDKASVVAEEFKEAMAQENDPKRLYRIGENIGKAVKDKRITPAQKKELETFYKQRTAALQQSGVAA